ncbi:MAG: hypothetical protein M3460_27185 [Actinomycetota bacterium]|nr:hypothetical protein [Actinomycetota bacterium]
MTGDLERQMRNYDLLLRFTAAGRTLSHQQRTLYKQAAYTADYMTNISRLYGHAFRLLADLDVDRQIEAGNNQLLNELFVQMELRAARKLGRAAEDFRWMTTLPMPHLGFSPSSASSLLSFLALFGPSHG